MNTTTWMLAFAALCLGCTPDAGGSGQDETSGNGPDDSTGPAATMNPTSGPPPSDDTTSSDPGTTGDDPPGTTTAPSESTGEPEGTSTGEPGCPAQTQVAWAFEAMIEPPMELVDSAVLEMQVARSWAGGLGTVTMELETTCDGPVYLWGLAWDNVSDPQATNPDSYFVAIDEQDEIVWEYGCAFGGVPDQSWRWVPIESATGRGCETEPLELNLAAGTHTIVIRNREDGVAENAARFAGLVLSHDPDADPTEFIDPP